jgi:CRP-like cAMP-binding protein
VLGENSRSSTVAAVTDSVLLEIERDVIRKIVEVNGVLLSFLNSEMNLGHEKIMKSQWGIKKKSSTAAKKAKKENASRSLQTFITDLFPSSSNKETS